MNKRPSQFNPRKPRSSGWSSPKSSGARPIRKLSRPSGRSATARQWGGRRPDFGGTKKLAEGVLRPFTDRAAWVWAFLFGVWLLFLSGAVTELTGTPGAIQALQLQDLLTARELQLKDLENQLKRTTRDLHELETNPLVQENEIRRVLGYAAKDELIFDFSAPVRARGKKKAPDESPR